MLSTHQLLFRNDRVGATSEINFWIENRNQNERLFPLRPLTLLYLRNLRFQKPNVMHREIISIRKIFTLSWYVSSLCTRYANIVSTAKLQISTYKHLWLSMTLYRSCWLDDVIKMYKEISANVKLFLINAQSSCDSVWQKAVFITFSVHGCQGCRDLIYLKWSWLRVYLNRDVNCNIGLEWTLHNIIVLNHRPKQGRQNHSIRTEMYVSIFLVEFKGSTVLYENSWNGEHENKLHE